MIFVSSQVIPSDNKMNNNYWFKMVFLPLWNRSIAEVILNWKSKCGRLFEGVEECPMCHNIPYMYARCASTRFMVPTSTNSSQHLANQHSEIHSVCYVDLNLHIMSITPTPFVSYYKLL